MNPTPPSHRLARLAALFTVGCGLFVLITWGLALPTVSLIVGLLLIVCWFAIEAYRQRHAAFLLAHTLEAEREQKILSDRRGLLTTRDQERQIEQMGKMYRCSSRLNEALVHFTSTEELFSAICRILVETGDFKMAWVGWLNPATRGLDPVASAGDDQGYVPALHKSVDPARPEAHGPSGTAFRTDQTYICHDFAHDPATGPWREAAARSGFRSSIALPLRLEGKPQGLLTVYATELDCFNGPMLAIMEEASANISFALGVQAGADRLRRSEARVQNLLNQSPYALVVTGLTDGIILYVNQPAADLFEVDRATIVGTTTHRFYGTPELRETMLALVRRDGAIKDQELMMTTAQGRNFHAQISLNVAEYDGHQAALISVFDITRRKQAEETLRLSEQRFRDLFEEVASVAVQGYAPDGTTLYWNQASERLYGYTAQEAIGRSLLDLIIPPEMRAGVASAVRAAVEEGKPIPAGELHLRRKDGSPVEVYSSHVVVQLTGRPPELFCLDIDLTEHKQAEKRMADQRDELLRWQDAMQGREDRVLEVKQEVNELLRQAGQPIRYPSAAEGSEP